MARSLASVACFRALSTLLAAAGALPAQQFVEPVRDHLPLVRDPSRHVVAGDVNGDGFTDLVYANSNVITGSQDRLLFGDGQGGFVEGALPATAERTYGVALGDVDGDGDQDLVAAVDGQNRVYLNDGLGSFAPAPFGALPLAHDDSRRPVLFDADGDGDLDVYFANGQQDALWLNDGSGAFVDGTATHLPARAASTWDAVAVDVDADGDLDLAVADYDRQTLLLNDGSGVFADATAARMPANGPLNPASIEAGDFDGDGDLDLLVANWLFSPNGGAPSLLLNDGAGAFTDASAGRVPTVGLYNWDTAVGDIDADGDLDVALGNSGGANVLLLNDGTARFVDVSAARLPALQNGTIDLTFADLEGDGDLDLCAADYLTLNQVLANDGSGHFVDLTPMPLSTIFYATADLGVGDFDGDGVADLVFANGESDGVLLANTVQRGDGRGGFLPVAGAMPAEAEETRSVAVGDLDNDGDLDCVFANANAADRVARNDGTGTFTTETLPVPVGSSEAVALADVDGDTDLDIILVRMLGTPQLLLNDGLGAFADASAQLPGLALEGRAVVCDDVDADGDIDLLLGTGLTQKRQNRLYLNDGTGTFSDATATHLPTSTERTAALAFGDVDGDGDLDLVLGNDGLGFGESNGLWLNDGTGRFVRSSGMVYDLFRTAAVALADVDLDGDLDLVCGDYNHTNKLYVNDGAGRFHDATAQRMPGVFESCSALAVTDLDGDGDPDLVSAGTGVARFNATVYVNRHRHVHARTAPRLGSLWTLEVASQAGYATQPQASLLLLGTQPASLPIAPFGTLGIDPAGLVVVAAPALQPAAGTASVVLPLPASPALDGLTVYLQALVVAPTPGFGNAIAETLRVF